MSSLAQALQIAIPVFVFLIAIEWLYGYFTNKQTNNIPDTVSSLSSGITNITKDVLGLSIAVISYKWIYTNYAFIKPEISWWMFIAVFIFKDFAGYWIHRFEHKVNYFWNRHIIHHSSEEFNLACALRQSISEIFSFTVIFLIPLAFLGVPPTVFAIVAPIHLFLQFWYHTRHINKMGFLENIIVTPSHHRVHHAINPQYLDKNFSQIFIFWDKLFGTFQQELNNIPPVYGVKRAVSTWNPIIINFQHAALVWSDFFRTNNWSDKFKIWFMPTGWRPADVNKKYPIEIIDDPKTQIKYMPQLPNWVKAWSVAQLLFVLALFFLIIGNMNSWTINITFMFSAFLFLMVFSYTSIMDNKRWATILEISKSILFVVFLVIIKGQIQLPIWILAIFISYQLLDVGLSIFRLQQLNNQ